MFRALQNGPAVVRRLATVASSSSTATLRLAAVPSCQVTSSTMAFLSTAAAAKKSAPAVASTTVGGQLLSSLTQENPHINVVRYHHKNRVWTLQHVEFYSEALAIGLAETGLIPGDAVLSWLPQHFSEQVCGYCNIVVIRNFSLFDIVVFCDFISHLEICAFFGRWFCSLLVPRLV
jgi:hypothetical protein